MPDAIDPLTIQPPPPRTPPRPQAKTDVDPSLEKNLKALQQQAQAESQKRPRGEQVPWVMPRAGEWSGDLFDWVGIHKAFDRSFSNDKFIEAIKDPKNPGTVYDLTIATTQIDYLATMERAFRSRHTFSRPRLAAHVCGRKRSYGSDRGHIIQGVLEYVRGMVKENKTGAGR